MQVEDDHRNLKQLRSRDALFQSTRCGYWCCGLFLSFLAVLIVSFLITVLLNQVHALNMYASKFKTFIIQNYVSVLPHV